MIIKSLRPLHFGPFAVPTTIELEDTVTVLTGSNDTGKTFALRLIELTCGAAKFEERDVNEDRISEHGGSWQDDSATTEESDN